MTTITPCLWFDGNGMEAAELYVSVIPNSRITEVSHYGPDQPGNAGAVMTVAFELAGRPFTALNGGPQYKFTEAISLQLSAADQEEVDRYTEQLTADGGEVAWFEARDGGADGGDVADDLVTGDHGEEFVAPVAVDLVDVGVADAAVVDGDDNVVGVGLATVKGPGGERRGLRGSGVAEGLHGRLRSWIPILDSDWSLLGVGFEHGNGRAGVAGLEGVGGDDEGDAGAEFFVE